MQCAGPKGADFMVGMRAVLAPCTNMCLHRTKVSFARLLQLFKMCKILTCKAMCSRIGPSTSPMSDY